MASGTPATSQKTTQRRKKAAVLALAGVVGIGAAATMANWTDEEFAGADLEAGQFNLQIATTAVGESPEAEDWVDGTSVSAFEDLEIMTGTWGPGDYDDSDVHVRLEPGTTHNAQLTSTRAEDAEFWSVTGPDAVDQTLAQDDVATFTVTVQMDQDAPNEAQGQAEEVVWQFTAEQLPNAPEDDGDT